MDVGKIKVTSARLKMELENIQKLYDTLKTKDMFDKKTLKQKLTDDFVLKAVGSIFHDFYTAVENMFKIVAKNIDGFMPSVSMTVTTGWRRDSQHRSVTDIGPKENRSEMDCHIINRRFICD